MQTDPFAEMHDRLADHFGARQSTIRGVPASRPISITHGVAITGEFSEVVSFRSVALIADADEPKGGDTIMVNGTTYVIDSLLDSDGYAVRCILR